MGKNSKKRHKRTYYERKGRCNRHHIRAKSLGGSRCIQNLILLDENRHAAFHLLFGLKTFKQAAEVLLRADRMKKNQ